VNIFTYFNIGPIAMSKKITQEIFEEIRKRNAKNDIDSIPHSDEFIHYLNISIGIDPDFARKLIKALINSHKIFAIEIASEEKNNNIPRIEGFVECDLKIIRNLKLFFQDELIRQYESEHYKRISYHQLIKEIMPIINTLNNTPVGQTANKAIMMGELERLMEKNFGEFTEEWKERHLDIELNKATAAGVSEKTKLDEKAEDVKIGSKPGHADSKKNTNIKNYSEIISKNKNYPLDRVLKIYGIDFFLRAQISRGEFAYLTELVESGKFLKNNDLLFLKDMLSQFKKNKKSDINSFGSEGEIYGLERAITHRLYFGHNYQVNP
jgi:hypothetical protein